MNWTVNLDNATFDFAENMWRQVYSVDLELTGAELRKFNSQHPRNPDGTFKEKGSGSSSSSDSGKNKNGSSSGSDKPSGKSSGPARFTDSNGDGKDDRQLTPAQLKEALKAVSPEMRRALIIYPAVLGAIKMALENGEDPKKHLERLPSNLRAAAEKAAKSIASGSGSSGDPKDPTGPIDVDEDTDEALVERLTAKGWAGNPSDSRERLYPPDHPKNPKNMSEPAWSVDLDGASFDFSEVAWKPDQVIELANGKKSKVSALIRKLRADPRVDDPERLAGWIRHNRGSGSGKSSGSGGSSSSGSSSNGSGSSPSNGSATAAPEKPKGRMVGGFYIDDDDEDEFLSDPFIDEEPKSKEEIEQEKYEAKVLRELEREVPENIYKTIMEFGGLKTRPDLREEYSEIPNVYKRKDGTYGDELADMLAQFYPQYGIETERDLIDMLAS